MVQAAGDRNIKCHRQGLIDPGWTELIQIGLGWSRQDLSDSDRIWLIQTVFYWSRLDWPDPDWFGMIQTGLGWSRLDWADLVWVGVIQTGLDRSRLDWAYPDRIRLIQIGSTGIYRMWQRPTSVKCDIPSSISCHCRSPVGESGPGYVQLKVLSENEGCVQQLQQRLVPYTGQHTAGSHRQDSYGTTASKFTMHARTRQETKYCNSTKAR